MTMGLKDRHTSESQHQTWDVEEIRKDFPLLGREMNGFPLVYLDSAATAQKPKAVIDRIHTFYQREYATIHRGIYGLSQDSTLECEEARKKCQRFLNVKDPAEIIFVRGTTEGINLIASSYGQTHLKAGDEILVTEVEHHANFVPWQDLALKKNLKFKTAPVNDEGELILEEFEKRITDKTRLVAVPHISNVLGTVFPLKTMIDIAHKKGALVVVDGAQGAPHMPVDVQALDCDFYTFSSHKAYGPTAIGILYGKRKLLESMPPYQFGGDMINQVTFEKTTFAPLPAKFEAGTPAFPQIIALGTALDYIQKIGFNQIMKHEHELLDYATERLLEIPGLKIYGTAKEKASLISFTLDEIHPHDIGTILDQQGIAIRAGHHCSQPTMQRFGVTATARASFAFYNKKEEVDVLVQALEKVRKMFT